MTLLDTYVEAAAASHRHLASLIVEALRLRLSQTRLGLSEYIDFQLYKTDIPWDAKAKFGGLRTQDALDEMLVDDYSRFLSLDKVTMYALLSGLGFPIPKVRATYRSIRPSCITQLHSPEQLEEFIATPGNLPIYVKRSFGGFGRGNVLIAAFDGTNIVLGNGARESAGDFCASLDDARSLGWILQEPLTSHPDIETLTGHGKISGLRVHTFLGLRDAKVIKAIFKINAGLRDIDNFDHGNSGNMLAAVDVQSGTIVRAVSGVGVRQVELPIHPTTQAPLLGFKIPGWSEVVSLKTSVHLYRRTEVFFAPPGTLQYAPTGRKSWRSMQSVTWICPSTHTEAASLTTTLSPVCEREI